MMDGCALSDMGYEGRTSNRGEKNYSINERLDKFLANNLWNNLFPMQE